MAERVQKIIRIFGEMWQMAHSSHKSLIDSPADPHRTKAWSAPGTPACSGIDTYRVSP